MMHDILMYFCTFVSRIRNSDGLHQREISLADRSNRQQSAARRQQKTKGFVVDFRKTGSKDTPVHISGAEANEK